MLPVGRDAVGLPAPGLAMADDHDTGGSSTTSAIAPPSSGSCHESSEPNSTSVGRPAVTSQAEESNSTPRSVSAARRAVHRPAALARPHRPTPRRTRARRPALGRVGHRCRRDLARRHHPDRTTAQCAAGDGRPHRRCAVHRTAAERPRASGCRGPIAAGLTGGRGARFHRADGLRLTNRGRPSWQGRDVRRRRWCPGRARGARRCRRGGRADGRPRPGSWGSPTGAIR